RGIDYRRLRPLAVAYEPVFYLESPDLKRSQVTMKRAIDIVGASIGLVLTAPLFALIALLIKLSDKGPVLFKQTRVGRDGTHFTVYKFRTMVVDAETKLRSLSDDNERKGPLF